MNRLSLCMMAVLALSNVDAKAADFFISPQGNDAWSGALAQPNADKTDGPFATLERARDEIRKGRADKKLSGPITVYLREGIYALQKTFALSKEDSGTTDARVTYRAYQDETVRLIGGKVITNWKPVTDEKILQRLDPAARGKVLAADLRAVGITEYGQVRSGGVELFFDAAPATLARWPNEGFVKIKDVTDEEPRVSHGRKGSKVGKFYYDGDRPKRWTGETDIWLHGYWFWDWADSYEKVVSVDADKGMFHLAKPYHGYGYRKGVRYYALNVLAELDVPGEWMLDRESGMLYFWPPGPIEAGLPMVSSLKTLITTQDVSHVTIRGLTLEAARGTAVAIRGGTKTRVVGCVLRNLGGSAVAISGGKENSVIGCDIYNLASGGISLSGGDRATLTPAGHLAENNHIHHYGLWKRTYTPAIGIAGVGNKIRHNLFHDAPHNAVQLGGNEHLIEFNEFHHVCLETDDVGAFYMGRNWTQRGNVIRYNYFHHLGRHGGGVGVMAVYLDDWASGSTVFGNVCYKAGRAVLIGGGRDNLIENNVFIDCKPAIHVDSRGLGWAKNYFNGTTTTLVDRLNEVDYKNPPWSTRYPQLLTLYDDEPAVAKGNVIRRNISVGGKWLDLHNGLTEKIVKVESNWVDTEVGFVDREHENFQLRDDSPVFKAGFKRIPIEKIGLYKDARRASWPGT